MVCASALYKNALDGEPSHALSTSCSTLSSRATKRYLILPVSMPFTVRCGSQFFPQRHETVHHVAAKPGLLADAHEQFHIKPRFYIDFFRRECGHAFLFGDVQKYRTILAGLIRSRRTGEATLLHPVTFLQYPKPHDAVVSARSKEPSMSQQYPAGYAMSTNRTRKPASSIPTAYGGASTRKAKSKSASISKATRCRRTPNVS